MRMIRGFANKFSTGGCAFFSFRFRWTAVITRTVYRPARWPPVHLPRTRTAHTAIMTCIFLVAKKVSESELCAVGACSRCCSRLLNDDGDNASISMWSANFILGRVVWPNMHDVWCPLARSMGFCVPMYVGMSVYAIRKRIIVRYKTMMVGAFIKLNDYG